jgi:hypothetical protein
VRLAEEYVGLIRKAPRRDFVVRTIARREANGMPLVTAEIVIAGEETRGQFPVAASYPLHFKKTYFPGRLRGEPAVEFERQTRAAELIWVPPAIGYTDDSFRSCIVPGLPYDRLSPFGAEPEDGNLVIARKLNLATAAGLYRLAEEAFDKLTALHRGGLRHGDAELHNFIVCPSPLELVPIDFEAADVRGERNDEEWQALCEKDFDALLREVIFLECCLGEQPGPIAAHAERRLGALIKNSSRFQREIGQRTNQSA